MAVWAAMTAYVESPLARAEWIEIFLRPGGLCLVQVSARESGVD